MFWFSKETERYKVIDSPVEVDFYDKPLYRILALKNGLHCKKGEFGGLVESKENLSTIGDSWIDYRSAVYNGGVVFGEALVLSSKIDGSSVYESANVMNSVVKNFARDFTELLAIVLNERGGISDCYNQFQLLAKFARSQMLR